MALPENHVYMSFGGSLPGGETWQTGLHLAHLGAGASQGTNQGMANALRDEVQSWFSDDDTGIDQRVRLNWLKLAEVDVNGHYTQDAVIETWTTPPSGGAGTGSFPNQVALVATLWTGRVIGKGQKGRIFIPIPGLAAGDDGRITAQAAQNVATRTAQFIRDVNTTTLAFTTPLQVVIASDTPPTSAFNEVTQVRVGRVLDTQRRRRRNLDEAYTVAPVAA